MQSLKILGVYRHPIFSNNAVEADRLILEKALSELQRISASPLQVELVEEAELAHSDGSYSLVLTMAQSADTLQLMDKGLAGATIFNSTSSIRNCYRKNMSRILSSHPVGYVPFQLLPTDGSIRPELENGDGYWLKRSDFHAIADEDVTLAESEEEVHSLLARFRKRGVAEVIVQRHIHGDIYKFYGVKGKLFRPIRVRTFLDSAPEPDFDQLERMATLSADALGLLIYGGDAILDNEGRFHLIDVNDWPSFRLCRDDAALAIAELSLNHLTGIVAARKQSPAASATRI